MKAPRNPDVADDIRLRHVFDDQAQQYDEARPHYPEALFDTLISKTHLAPDSRLLEIGPGTGQATQSLAKRGYTIVAVELGGQLAALARRQLKDYSKVQIITAAFEDVELAEESFDLVYSATAFHWIRPEARYAKPHRLLKPGGHLAIIHTNHVSDEHGDAFFHASRPIYDKYTPSTGDQFRLPRVKDLQPQGALDKTLFKLVHFECFPLTVAYTAQQYAKLLGTYSPHLALPPASRAKFLGEIEALINDQFGGVRTKHYAMSLTLARKV